MGTANDLSDVGSVRLTFGRYEGRRVKDCPNGYLVWMIENLSPADPLIAEAKAVMFVRQYQQKNRRGRQRCKV